MITAEIERFAKDSCCDKLAVKLRQEMLDIGGVWLNGDEIIVDVCKCGKKVRVTRTKDFA